jgi:hypothetical protein
MSGVVDGTPRRVGVVPFELTLVQNFLDREKIPFAVDGDGDFVVNFGPHAVHGFEVTAFLMAQGVNGEVYALRSVSNIRLAEPFIQPAVAACNNWMMHNMMPMAFVVGETVDDEIHGAIILQYHFPLSAGVTQPIVDEFTSNFFGAASAFWEWFATDGVAGMNALVGGDGDETDDHTANALDASTAELN